MDQTLYIGDVYEEKGASIPDGWVLYISGSVDTSTAGVYEIEYYALNPETGQNVIRIKTVEVVQRPGITLVGEPVITVSLPDIASYADAGATSPDGTVLVTNLDGTASESFTGLRSIAGSYTLIYYLSGSFSNFVTRTIHVSDPNSGGGGGVSAPASGPTGLDASTVSTPPASGPTGLDAVLETAPVKPAVGYPIVGKPAVGYPIVGKPAVGYPITNIQP